MAEETTDEERVAIIMAPKKPANDIVIVEIKPPTLNERMIQMMMNAFASFLGALLATLVWAHL